MTRTILEQLDDDWRDTVQRNRGRIPWPRHPALRRFHNLDDVITFVHERRHPLATDRVLSSLARRAALDVLAARTLLQAMTPALRKIAVTLRHRADADEVAAAIVAVAWEQIRTYPHQRRPERIAANLAYDTFRRANHDLAAEETEPLEDAMASVESPIAEPWELAAVVQNAVHRGEIHRDNVELIIQTRILGRTLAELADEQGITEARLRKRRWRSEKRLSQLAHGQGSTKDTTTTREP